MIMVVGLGNPGSKYDGTRHNMGFEVMDVLADKYNVTIAKKEHKALTGRCVIAGQPVLLVKPQTYMNLSGESVMALSEYYKIAPEDILVIFDDIHMEPGQLRLRKKGSAGGHNGIKNIIAMLGTDAFPRVRVGVGEPGRIDLIDFVLGRFHGDDVEAAKEGIQRAAEAVEMILADGMEMAMNRCNQKIKKA